MSHLKEILKELCLVNNPARDPMLPSWWSKQVVNRVGLAATDAYDVQRAISSVRNDQIPMDDEGEALRIDDYGDVRGGDDFGMRGDNAMADGPQDDMHANEFEEYEEIETEPCGDCHGTGEKYDEPCHRCNGEGFVDSQGNPVSFDEEEEDQSMPNNSTRRRRPDRMEDPDGYTKWYYDDMPNTADHIISTRTKNSADEYDEEEEEAGLLGKIKDHLERKQRSRLSKKLTKRSKDAEDQAHDAYFNKAQDYDFADPDREEHEAEFMRQSKRSRRYAKAADHYAEEEEDEMGPVGGEEDAVDPEMASPEDISPEEIDDQYGDEALDGEQDFNDEIDQEWDNPDFQGVIRTVPNAHLVYKRQQEDGTFNELWTYNIGEDFRHELGIRRSILAGTDIPTNKMVSPDNSQSYELWTAGNAQLMHIRGLPN